MLSMEEKGSSPVFVVGEEGVRNPDFLRKITGEREDFLFVAEGEPLVLPVLVQVHRDRVILQNRELCNRLDARARQNA